jgi:hypothetical protein
VANKINGAWRIRCNQELCQLCNGTEIIQEIKATRLMLLAHLFSKNKLYPCRKLTFTSPDIKRKVGKPHIRWMVLKTLNEAELTTVKEKIQRQEWFGEESLRRSRLEPGFSTNMYK